MRDFFVNYEHSRISVTNRRDKPRRKSSKTAQSHEVPPKGGGPALSLVEGGLVQTGGRAVLRLPPPSARPMRPANEVILSPARNRNLNLNPDLNPDSGPPPTHAIEAMRG